MEAWQKTHKPSLGQWFLKSGLDWGAKTLVGDPQCQTIFIIMQRLYLPFSLCWRWHRGYKSNRGKTFSNLAEIKALGPNCLLVIVSFTSSHLRFKKKKKKKSVLLNVLEEAAKIIFKISTLHTHFFYVPYSKTEVCIKHFCRIPKYHCCLKEKHLCGWVAVANNLASFFVEHLLIEKTHNRWQTMVTQSLVHGRHFLETKPVTSWKCCP